MVHLLLLLFMNTFGNLYFLFNFGTDDTFRVSAVSLAVLCFLFLYTWNGTMFHVFVS